MDQVGAGASKRKRQGGDGITAVEAGPRAKRRKETSGMSITIPAQKSRASGTPAQEAASEEHEEEGGGQDGADEDVQGTVEGVERVRELGLQIWQAVRGARSNELSVLILLFVYSSMLKHHLTQRPRHRYRLSQAATKETVSRLLHNHQEAYRFGRDKGSRAHLLVVTFRRPHAHLLISQSKIESGSYPTLRAVKKAFDQCFRNAKRYNMSESPIWVAAKIMQVWLTIVRHIDSIFTGDSHAQKIASKEYKKLAASPDTEEEDVDVGDADVEAPHDTPATAAVESDDDDDADDGDDGDEPAAPNGATAARKSSRKQSLSRILKSRLQKLIKKAPKEYVFPSSLSMIVPRW